MEDWDCRDTERERERNGTDGWRKHRERKREREEIERRSPWKRERSLSNFLHEQDLRLVSAGDKDFSIPPCACG